MKPPEQSPVLALVPGLDASPISRAARVNLKPPTLNRDHEHDLTYLHVAIRVYDMFKTQTGGSLPSPAHFSLLL